LGALLCLPARLVHADRAQELATQVKSILTTNCYRCHGERGAAEGGMAYVADLSKLVERKKVLPNNPAGSKLFKKMASEDDPMPPLTDDDNKPITQRPTKADIALVRQWIEAGAPPEPATAVAARPFISDTDILDSIKKDLDAADERARVFLRYFTITHLYNAGLDDDELQTYRGGLSKLVNSLSWGRRVVVPAAIDPQKTILRIDLRDYKWNEEIWNHIVAAYSYKVVPWNPTAREIYDRTKTQVPAVRADWFVFAASRPPLYHEVLDLPNTDAELEKILKVDVAEDIRTERVARAGFNGSGVSRNNRMIERHDSPYGAYWKSYDFKHAAGNERKNIFAHPLGPGTSNDFFEQDGGEIIFNLPNGLQAYMLVNATGQRIDRGPTEIVSDPKQEDRSVVNGVSCMSCHARGMIEKTDQVRQTVLSNPGYSTHFTVEPVKALYPEKAAFDALLKDDAERFLSASDKTGVVRSKSEPVVALSHRFEAELDPALAAAEAGVTPAELRDLILRSYFLGPRLGALNVPGGTVQRDVFADAFGRLAEQVVSYNFSRRPFPPPDPTAIAALQQRTSAGDVEAMYDLAIRYQVAHGVATDLAKGKALLEQAAAKGYVPAMLRLGDMYASDPLHFNLAYKDGNSVLGVRRDPAQAVAWYTRAAKAGSPLATAELGACYEKGLGFAPDAAKAQQLYARAVELAKPMAYHDASAALCLAFTPSAENGPGPRNEFIQSRKWLEKAAELGDPIAITWIEIHRRNNDPDFNPERQLQAYQQAGDGGCLIAIYYIAFALDTQVYTVRFDKAATPWYRRAADAGFLDAMTALARRYELGRGIAQDQTQAAHWYELSAQCGDQDSMVQLARRYEAGNGVPRDMEQAIKWMRAAHALNDPNPELTPKVWLREHHALP
jgi:TPR repeat protein